MLESVCRPYREGDMVYFSTYARSLDILTGTIVRVGETWEFCTNTRIFFIREARTGKLYSTARELIYGFVYS